MTEHDDWLNLATEKEALEPDLSICDAHHHIWSHESRRYLAADFLKDVGGGHNIKQTIVVQSRGNYEPGPGGGMSPVDETVYVMQQVAGLKSKIDVAAGLIGYVDMSTGKAVQAVLEGHLEAGKKRFKGIRYPLVPVLTTQRILSDPGFREAFAFLPKYKLTYDLMGGTLQFPELVDLAKKFPDTPIIIEHLGWPKLPDKNPGEKAEIIAEWRRMILMVAPVDNIYMKLGGSAMPDRGFGFDKKPRPPTSEEMVKAVSPYYQFLIEQFGPRRCMFESNFPPDRLSATYTVIWNAFKLMTKSFSRTERAYLFHDTANQVYNL